MCSNLDDMNTDMHLEYMNTEMDCVQIFQYEYGNASRIYEYRNGLCSNLEIPDMNTEMHLEYMNTEMYMCAALCIIQVFVCVCIYACV